jgi:choline dehydrogenase-like flavoprotein
VNFAELPVGDSFDRPHRFIHPLHRCADDIWHGRSGPFPIRQRTAEENTPSMRAFVEASAAIGLMRISDFNGAIIWTRSQTAEADELDVHISGTHLIDPNASPTSGAIVLACSVTLPKSIGRLRLSSRDPRVAPLIHYNLFDDPNDLDRLLEVVQLSRKLGRTAPFSNLIDHEMTPGKTVNNDEALRANIVANVAAYLHGTSTVPMGADTDPTVRQT